MSDRPVRRFDAAAVNRHFGFELTECSDGAAEVRFRAGPEHVQEYGVVHGGIVAALADTAAVYAVLPGLAGGDRMTSIEFKVNFLGPAAPEAGALIARSGVVRRGRTVAVVRADVDQDGRRIATGLFTYILMSRGEED